jgi:hypothetical protein
VYYSPHVAALRAAQQQPQPAAKPAAPAPAPAPAPAAATDSADPLAAAAGGALAAYAAATSHRGPGAAMRSMQAAIGNVGVAPAVARESAEGGSGGGGGMYVARDEVDRLRELVAAQVEA